MGKRGPKRRVWTVGDIEALAVESNGCLVWSALRDTNGYGLIGRNGTTQKAHRAIWEVNSGADIPRGMNVLHRCDNRPCIKLDHLFLGTQADNILDMMKKGRHWNAKLNAVTAKAIKTALATDERHKAIAERFGVSLSTVKMIRSGYNWTHVT